MVQRSTRFIHLESEFTTMPINKTLSDIERDIGLYYQDPKPNDLDIMLKIAARALTVAAELHGGEPLTTCKQLLFDLLLERSR
jgi:hypothetical protein